MDRELFERWMKETHLVRSPTTRLATFGATRIDYHLVSPVDGMPGKTRLREGSVLSEKPAVLTPESLRERFDGFGEEAGHYKEFIDSRYGELLRALEYRFKNMDFKTTVLASDARATAERIKAEADARTSAQDAVIACPDPAWSLALMTFTLEEARRSFPGNVQDLERRGKFDPDGGTGRRRRGEIEGLFERARRDTDARRLLGLRLREYGLASEYEDRFLGLFP